jgi:hypothetical protein
MVFFYHYFSKLLLSNNSQTTDQLFLTHPFSRAKFHMAAAAMWLTSYCITIAINSGEILSRISSAVSRSVASEDVSLLEEDGLDMWICGLGAECTSSSCPDAEESEVKNVDLDNFGFFFNM